MKMSQKVCFSQVRVGEINEGDSSETKCNLDACDSVDDFHTTFACVPFNSPQDGLHTEQNVDGNTVLDQVSKTLASLYCDNECEDRRISQSKCQVINYESAEVENDKESLLMSEECQNVQNDTNDESGIAEQDANFCLEENKCVEKLSQCEISKHKSCTVGKYSSEYLHQHTSRSHQIKFASQLELMPACLHNVPDLTESTKICICEGSEIAQMLPLQTLNLGQEMCYQITENRTHERKDVFGNGTLQYQFSNLLEPLETNLSDDCLMNDDSLKKCITKSYSQTDASRFSDIPVVDSCISSNVKADRLMEISHTKRIPSLSFVNNSDLLKDYDGNLIADVRITMNDLLENCCRLFHKDDENANKSINQYAAKQSASGRNRLDMSAENESGLHLECTSLAKYLKASSSYTNSSTINEANTSDLMKIGETSADCQVPMTIPCHDNKQLEIGKSHENVATLALHSSQNDPCEAVQCVKASPKLMDSCLQFTQVSTNLVKEENTLSGNQPSLQRFISDNRSLKWKELHTQGLQLNEALISKKFSLKKDDLISGSGACSHQAEIQVPEISVKEALLSSMGLSVSDFHSDIALTEEMTMRKEEICTSEIALVSTSEDIYAGENKLIEAYSRSEGSEKCSGTADKNIDEIGPCNQCTEFEDFRKESIHSAEDVECERNILPVETNDDISHPSSSSKSLNPDTWKEALTIHTKMNENVMDLHGTSSRELLVEDVSKSKNAVNGVNLRSISTTEENDLAGTVLNSHLLQSTVVSENNEYVTNIQTVCTQGDQMKGTVSCIKPTVSEKLDGYYQQDESELMSTLHFTASISKVSTAEYLRDNRDMYDPQADKLSTKDECLVPEIVNDHVVPNTVPSTACESDITMYEDNAPCNIKEKENAKVEHSPQQQPCFKWKYAPSLNIDDIMVTADSKNYDEDALLTVQPLKTCTRPIRVGLSKKYRAKPLHIKNHK